MANPSKYQTLSELTDRILLRLGFVAQNAGDQHKLIHEFLYSSQEELIIDFEDMLLKDVYLSDSFIVGESLYDIYENCDPEQIIEVGVRDGQNDNWRILKKGIPLAWRDDDVGEPIRYDIRWSNSDTNNTAQIEFYPTPDEVLEFGYRYKRNSLPFTQAQHRTTIDSELVYLLALSKAQAHYGYEQDALVSAANGAKRISKLREKSNHGRLIRRGYKRGKQSSEKYNNCMNVRLIKK